MFKTLTFTVDYEKEYEKQLAENCSLEAELLNLKEKTHQQELELIKLKTIVDVYNTIFRSLEK